MASFDSDTRLSLEPQLIYGSWMLALSSSAFDCQNLSLAYKNIWTHIFFPRQAIWSPLVQFSFPFRDILFGHFSTIRLQNASKPKMMFIEIDSIGEADFHAGLTESSISLVTVTSTITWPERFHVVYQCGEPGSQDHERISQIRQRYQYFWTATIC